jgi:hypothetical protein
VPRLPVWRARGVDVALDHSLEMVVAGKLGAEQAWQGVGRRTVEATWFGVTSIWLTN